MTDDKNKLSAIPSAGNLNSSNPANPAVDDAPLPFGLKPPGSDELNGSTAPVAPTPAPPQVAPTPPPASNPVERPASPALSPARPDPSRALSREPAERVAEPAPPSAPRPPIQQNQTPKENRFGFVKKIFQKNKAVSLPDAPASQIVGKTAIIKRPTGRVALILEIFVGALVAIIAVFFIFFYRAQININPTPAPDKILLDQREVKMGNYKVKPGIHSIEIKKDGYVTYRLSAEYKINQRMAILTPLIRATEPQTVLAGATEVRMAQNGKLAYFLTADGQIASVGAEPQDGKFQPYVLTSGSYLGPKKLMYSADGTYALAQFDDSIKIVSFSKPGVLDQVEARLPLDASQMSSIAWNDTASDYVGSANSQIVYDKNDSNTWNLIQSDIQNTKPSILMTIDPSRFANIFIDWGMNAKKVLIVGRELGVLDLGTRVYEKINENVNFKWGAWGPQGKYAVVIDESGNSYVLSDLKVKKLDLKTAPNLISWVSKNKAIIVSDGRPVQIDFDTMTRINYAEINTLKNAASFAVIGGRAVFADNIAVKIAPLTENIYK